MSVPAMNVSTDDIARSSHVCVICYNVCVYSYVRVWMSIVCVCFVWKRRRLRYVHMCVVIIANQAVNWILKDENVPEECSQAKDSQSIKSCSTIVDYLLKPPSLENKHDSESFLQFHAEEQEGM